MIRAPVPGKIDAHHAEAQGGQSRCYEAKGGAVVHPSMNSENRGDCTTWWLILEARKVELWSQSYPDFCHHLAMAAGLRKSVPGVAKIVSLVSLVPHFCATWIILRDDVS